MVWMYFGLFILFIRTYSCQNAEQTLDNLQTVNKETTEDSQFFEDIIVDQSDKVFAVYDEIDKRWEVTTHQNEKSPEVIIIIPHSRLSN